MSSVFYLPWIHAICYTCLENSQGKSDQFEYIWEAGPSHSFYIWFLCSYTCSGRCELRLEKLSGTYIFLLVCKHLEISITDSSMFWSIGQLLVQCERINQRTEQKLFFSSGTTWKCYKVYTGNKRAKTCVLDCNKTKYCNIEDRPLLSFCRPTNRLSNSARLPCSVLKVAEDGSVEDLIGTSDSADLTVSIYGRR